MKNSNVKLKLNEKHFITKKDYDYFQLNPQFKCTTYIHTVGNEQYYILIPTNENTLPTIENYLNGHKFKFKRNSWHVKLIKYIWGYDSHDFPYVCNYFWLAVFTVCIAPLVTPFKLLAQLILVLIKYSIVAVTFVIDLIPTKKLKKYFEERSTLKFEDEVTKVLNRIQAAYETNNFKLVGDDYRRYVKCNIKYIDDAFNRFKDNNNYWSDDKQFKLINRFFTELESYNYGKTKSKQINLISPNLQLKIKSSKSSLSSRRQELSDLIKLIKPLTNILMYAIGSIIGVSLLFIMYTFIPSIAIFIYDCLVALYKFLVNKWLDILYIVLFLGILVISTIAVINIVGFLRNHLKFSIKNSWLCDAIQFIGKCFKFIMRILYIVIVQPILFIINMFVWISSGLVELYYIIKALKSENCPAIEWEEDDTTK